MVVTEGAIYEGRSITLSWDGSTVPPPRELITQASGYCFTDKGEMVLVSAGEPSWTLPGGHPEESESIEEALRREVWEEACALVQDLVYIGAQRVDDPLTPDGLVTYYQTRFWARVRLERFLPLYETRERILVEPDQLFTTLQWTHSLVAEALFESALQQEQCYQRLTRALHHPTR